MKLVSKLAAFGAAAALTTTGLAAAGTAADAATVTKAVTYNCDLSGVGLGTQQVTTDYSVPAFSSALKQGTAVPSMPISAKVTVPASVSAVVVAGFGGSINGTVSGNVSFGAAKVPASLTIPASKISDPTKPATVSATGKLAAFTASTAGAQAVSLPSAVTATFQNGALSVSCNAATGSNLSLGTVTVSAAKTFLVKAPKSVKLHKAVKIKVTTNQTGKVIAKIKGKKVAKAKVKAGHATLKVKKHLKKGKNKIVVSLGSLHKTVKVKVKGKK